MKTIGILGGMGATAGVDLANKVISNTIANTDHDYIPMTLLSYPHQIADRTAFLQHKITENPAHNIVKLIQKLETLNVSIIGMPCNTAHSPQIYNVITDKLQQLGSHIKLANMVEATAKFLSVYYPNVEKVGLLATLGTYHSCVYESTFANYDIQIVQPNQPMRECVHQSIYDTEYGIKSGKWLEHKKIYPLLYTAIEHLLSQQTEVIILGCSELSLALAKSHYKKIPLLDPTTILARELIQQTYPEKLKPLHIEQTFTACSIQKSLSSSPIHSIFY